MSSPVEVFGIGGRVVLQPDGTYAIAIQITGLKEADAAVISELLQPLINNAVAEVLQKRGHVRSDYRPPGKPH